MPLSNRLNRFWRLLAEEDCQSLLAEIGEMGPIDPRLPEGEELLFVWALALWRDDQIEAAAQKMRDLLEVNSHSAAAHAHLANILDELEKYEEADRHYARANELAPNTSGILADWAIMLSRAGEYERAHEKFLQAERLGADNDDLFLYWGLAHEGLGNLEEACVSLETYIGRGLREAFALGRLGMIYVQLDRLEEAEDLLREALAQEPRQPDHIYNLAFCLKSQARLEEAKTLADQLAALEPGNAESWRLLGEIELERGNAKTALRRYKRSLQIDPQDSYALSGLGWIAFYDGRYEEAALYCRRALASDSGNASALDLLRALRPENPQLSLFLVEIRGETRDGAWFYKSMDCLAETEDEAEGYIRFIQEIFAEEAWWEIEEIRRAEPVSGERPGVCWISQYDFVEPPAPNKNPSE